MLSFGNTFRPTIGGTGASWTGSTAEVTLATIVLPAGIMGSNGLLRVTAFWTFTNVGGGTRTPRIKFGGTNITGNANANTVLSQNMIGLVNNKTALTQTATGLGSANGLGASTATSLSLAIDTTAAVTILLTGQLSNSTDTIALDRYIIEVVK
jgi:hypothetical protein